MNTFHRHTSDFYLFTSPLSSFSSTLLSGVVCLIVKNMNFLLPTTRHSTSHSVVCISLLSVSHFLVCFFAPTRNPLYSFPTRSKWLLNSVENFLTLNTFESKGCCITWHSISWKWIDMIQLEIYSCCRCFFYLLEMRNLVYKAPTRYFECLSI